LAPPATTTQDEEEAEQVTLQLSPLEKERDVNAWEFVEWGRFGTGLYVPDQLILVITTFGRSSN
jgi:hypothetical protein